MSEVPEQTLEEMFLEMFGGWRNRIEEMKRTSDNELFVKLMNGQEYRFGVKPNRDIFLNAIPSQK